MNKKIWGPVAVLMLLAVLLGGAFLLLRLSRADARRERRANRRPGHVGAVPTPTPTPTPTPEPTPEPEDADLVVVQDVIPTIYVELHYATTDNFTGQVIYDFTDARLRYGTVKKLARVQQALLEQGYSLKIWDAYRPVHAQFRLWEVCPNSAYVANPNTGYSSHSRGNTVDLTLVRRTGRRSRCRAILMNSLRLPTGITATSPPRHGRTPPSSRRRCARRASSATAPSGGTTATAPRMTW